MRPLVVLGSLLCFGQIVCFFLLGSRNVAVPPNCHLPEKIKAPLAVKNTTVNEEADTDTKKKPAHTRSPFAGKPKIAIGIVSAFDWGVKEPYFSFRARRQMHRDTWMKHPAVNTKDGPIQVYFIIGDQMKGLQGMTRTYEIKELQPEMDHYGDVLLLNDTADLHNHGKMNAWYEWAAATNDETGMRNIQADYHVKLDDESYVVVDRLMEQLEEANWQRFFGGSGWRFEERNQLKNVPFLRGWGYILSDDLMAGLGECSKSGELERNHGTEHEDVYTGYAIKKCGMDDTTSNKGLNFYPKMRVQSLLQILSGGCQKKSLYSAMFIHCGTEKSHVFGKLGSQTFQTLHSIHHPYVGDHTPAWTKWEGLRQLYLNDIGACSSSSPMTKRWACEPEWQNSTCIPQK